jgi:hypothetical protein
MMSLHRNAIRFFLFAVALTLPLSAYAANYDVKVLMDTDINRSTGCVVSTASGPVAGIEQVLTTSVSVTGGTATVTGVTRQLCTSGFLGSPIPVDGGWNVGVSSTGNLFVETHVGANVITMTNVGTMRLSFVVTSGSLSDAMTSDFGDDILYPVRPGRHRAVLTGTPRTIHLDGVNTDWAGLPVLAYGDAAPPALRFLDAAAYVDSGDFFFDFDLQTNINAPTALDDTYPLPTVGGTLNVTTLGVLTNDSDPNGLALSTILVEGPEHGTLTLNADGGFTYVNDGSDSQQDHFRYRVTNGTLQSNLATVTINLPGGGGASEGYTFTSADHVTFAAAQPNSFTVTVTGKPTPALSEDGALPAGLTFVDNGDGTGTLSGTPSGTSGGIYNIVFHAEKNKPHQTDQNFTLTIGQAPGITSAPNTTFTAGSAGSFQVTAIGFPAPSFGESGALPSGVSFNSGTGTLSGTPGPGTGGVYHITFTATNSFGSDIQAFTLTVDEAPSFTSANNVHLQAGSPANFTVTTNGFPPAAITKTSGALPAGVTFTDNGNGTATIGGTPAGGSGGTYPIVFHAANVAGSANQNFTIVVCNSLTVTNPATTTGTVNAAFSQTFTQSGGVGAVAFSLNSGTLPAGLTLSSAGVLSGTPTQSGSFPITVRVVDSNGCIGIGATYNLIINCQTITVTNPGPNTGTVNIAFSQTFTASNTIGAVTFSTASTLPAGLTLSAGGVLSGTPTQTGSFPIVVKATDANGCFGNGATYTLTIGCQTITVNNPGTNSGTVNVAFSQTFTASNTIGALTFSTASTLPTGIALSSGGVLSGTPTQTGSFPIVVHVVDANGCSANGATYTLTIACQVITVNNPGTSSGTVNVAFSQTFTTTNAIGATTFTTASTLPTGLSLSTGGVLSGTPTQTGSFPIVGHVVDANGCAGNGATYTLTIACQVITVNNPGTSSGTVNVAFSQTFTATNAIGATTFNTASTLPTGLSLSTGGVLSGTPTQTGSFPIVVHVVDANGCSGNGATYTLTIACQVITVNNPGTNSGTVNSAFSQTFTTSNAIGTVTFTTASTLPTGLSLSTGGVLSGTPLQVGSFPIVVHAVDANGCSGNGATYTLTIGCQIISVTNPATTTGTVNTAFSQTFTAGNTVGTVTFTTASTLPTGLSLSTGGVLSGTPTQTGSFPIVVTATDGNGCSGSGSTYTLVIGCQTITVTNPSNTTGTVSAPFTEVFTSSNTIGAVTYSTASTLPAGLTLASNGTLSGTPTQSGTFPIVVTATDANGCMGNGATYTLVIGCQVITVNNPATTSSPAGTPLSINFTQSGSIGTATFTTASTLPAGLTLDPDGTLHGTPTQNGPFPIVVTVTDSNGCTGTNSAYTLTLTCPTITVTNPGTTTGTVNVAFSQTFTQSGGVGTTTFSIFSGTLPTGLTFHPATGVLDGTPTQTGSFPLVIRATDANGCTGDGATYTLVIGCQVITVNNPGTNSGTVNTAFSQTFTAGNTIGAVTFSLNSGTLPAGLSLSTGGVLSGTPTQTGSFPITVKATDANGCSGIGATYTLTIGCQVISVTNPSTATGTVNTAFGQTFTAGNTVGAVTFTTASTLPTGLSLSTGGVLSGTPTQSGSFPIVVTATDGNGCSGSGSTYTLVIGCQTITVTNPVNSTGTVNVGFSEQFTAGNTIGSVTFTTASALPAGITLSTGGLLSGTPTQAGSFPIVVTATDANGCSGNGATYTLVINCQTITVTNPVNATGPAGTPFSETFTQSGAIGTVTWSETGALPTGITLNPSTGVLSGTPLQGGCFPITVTVTDSNGCTGAGPTYTLCITCPTITVTNPGVSTGTAGTAFSQTFTQSGGIGTMTWSETGALPSGITLNSSTGVLSGTTSQVGTFPITVTATDSNGCQGTGPTYNLTINCQTITVTNPGVNTGTVDAPFSQTFTKSGILGTVTWTETGTLPLGVALNSSTGVLSGTPGQPGSFPITVTATDTNGCSGTGPIYTLTIACQTITVTKPGVTTGTVDTPFSQTFTQSGVGTHTPATFTLNSGSLPSGLSLSTAGVLSGTPDQPGTFPITVKVTDANGCTGVSSTYTLVIACQTITVTNPATTTGTVAVAFSQTFTQSGVGTHTPATFTTASTLPTGFTLSTAGVLSGTTNQHGTFPIVVTVTDVNGCTGTGATYNLVINCQTITVTNPGVTTGTVGTPFSQTFTQSGAIGGATFTTASTLPLGLSLSTAGVLSGTPTQSGTFPIVVTVTDGNGCTGTGSTYTLIIACNVINVTNPATTTGTAGVAFSATFTQSGGNGTIVWSKTGALPAGISLNSSTGVLSGTTTATGSFPITVTATDANGCTGTGPTYTLVINCQTVTVTNPGTTTGTAGVAFSQTFTASGILGSATWSEVGALPSGFTFSAAGVLSGTTSQIGSFPITVKATDTNGCFGTSSYTLVIVCQTVTVTNPGVTAATFNVPFSATFTASGILGSATFTLASGTLPTGMSLSAAGVLSGTPTQTGTFPITVKATDTNTCNGTGATYTLSVAPVASGDSYSNLVDNTQAVVTGGGTSSPGTPFVTLSGAIIANDTPAGGVTANPGTFATSAGGSVTIATDGTFIYTPKANPGAAATTTDTFTYTVSSNTGGVAAVNSAAATVTLNLTGRVWYVKNNGGGSNGQSQSPFTTLAAAAGASTANDIIFVYNGDGTNSGQDAGIALKNGQQLLGEINGLTVNAQTLVAAGSRPTIGNSGGAGVTVAASTANGDRTGIFIKGLSIAGTTSAISISSANAQTLTATVDNVNITAATANHGVSVAAAATLTSTVTVQNSTISGVAQNGIDAQQTTAGNLVLNINNNAVSATGTGINVVGTGSTSTTITNFASNAISGNTGGSGITVTTATFDATPGGTFQTVSGGTTTIGAAGNGVGANGMVLTNVAGDLSFTDLDIVTSNGTGLFASGTTPFTGSAGFQIAVASGVGTIDATGGAAADLSTVTANLPFTTIKSATSVSTGVNLNAVLGTFTAGSGSSITNATSTDFNISGGTATVTYDGTITDTTGRAVSVASTTGGTKTFSGAITNNGGTGISLTSNTGATINFSGTIILSTGATDAFTATGGGTVTATNTSSTLTTTTGTALNVANTTIGAGGLKFQSISAGTGASGPTSGIILNNTGSSGGLTISGTGSAGTGGTIQKMTGAGISLTSTKNVSLSFMDVQNGSMEGILGTSVDGFTLTSCSVTGNSTSGNNRDGIKLTDTVNAVTFTSDTVTGNFNSNVQLTTGGSSTAVMTTLTVTGGTYSTSTQNVGFLVDLHGSAALNTASVSGATFSGNFSKGIQFQHNDNCTMGNGIGAPATGTITVNNNTITNNDVGASFESGGTGGTGSAYYRFTNNATITGNHSLAVNFANGSTVGNGAFKVFCDSNHIGTAGVPNSGAAIGEGIRLFAQGKQTVTAVITNNTIRDLYNGAGGFDARGIDVEELGSSNTGQGQTSMDVTITGNNVDQEYTGSTFNIQYAIYVACDGQASGSGSNVHADIHGNTVPTQSACDSSPCAGNDSMIWMETVSNSNSPSGALYNLFGEASVNAAIINHNTGTAGKAAATQSGVGQPAITLTATAPNTVN